MLTTKKKDNYHNNLLFFDENNQYADILRNFEMYYGVSTEIFMDAFYDGGYEGNEDYVLWHKAAMKSGYINKEK